MPKIDPPKPTTRAGCPIDDTGTLQKVRTYTIDNSPALAGHCWECRRGHHHHCDDLRMQFCECRRAEHEETF